MAKAGRPKNVRPHDIRIYVPKTDLATLQNKAKRIYWALLEYEKKMAKDITAVKMKDYTDLLDAYADVCNDLRKKGYKGKHAKKGMDQDGFAESDSRSGTEAGTSQDGQTDLGPRVRAVNPIT